MNIQDNRESRFVLQQITEEKFNTLLEDSAVKEKKVEVKEEKEDEFMNAEFVFRRRTVNQKSKESIEEHNKENITRNSRY